MDIKQNSKSEDATLRAIIVCGLALTFAATLLPGQNTVYRSPKIAGQVVLVEDSVVQTQWPHTLPLVNAPRNVTQLNPGQCVRVGVYATGDHRDVYLKTTRLSFHIKFDGHDDAHPLALLSEYKQIKPEGGDFVTAALGAAGVKEPESVKTMASLGVSGERWCVPANAKDGAASIGAEVETPDGRQTLRSATISIQSFATGSTKSFKNLDEFGNFSQTYYRQPDSARLVPALQFFVESQMRSPRAGQAKIFGAFLTAALKSDPVAARYFQTQIASQSPIARAMGLLALRAAGYDIGDTLNRMSPEEQQKFKSLPDLENPYDLAPTQALFEHLDMMWAVFAATGELKPVETVANALSWKTDYEAFDKLRHTPNHPSTLTPSLVRGVVYMAAGWSLKSFQRNDPLVADYIDALLASPDTSQSIKVGLSSLDSDPAFRQPGT